MKKTFVILILCFFCMLASISVYGKNPPPPQNKSAAPPPNPGLAIDGGLVALFLAGIAFGVSVIKKKNI